jgi:hypothetical protein
MIYRFCITPTIMPEHFILSKNACFWRKIINIKKGHVRKKSGPIYSDSACFSHAKTAEQVGAIIFFNSGAFNLQGANHKGFTMQRSSKYIKRAA